MAALPISVMCPWTRAPPAKTAPWEDAATSSGRTHKRENLKSVERHTEFGTIFLWVPASHAGRVPFRGLNGRSIRDVSRTEIASVIDTHRHELGSAEDPILALSRRLGIARLSKDARAYLSDCARWRQESTGAEN